MVPFEKRWFRWVGNACTTLGNKIGCRIRNWVSPWQYHLLLSEAGVEEEHAGGAHHLLKDLGEGRADPEEEVPEGQAGPLTLAVVVVVADRVSHQEGLHVSQGLDGSLVGRHLKRLF